nr:thymocyte nuclear protein 1 [Quercus suber]
MPPKKSKAMATPSKPGRPSEAPASITTNRGKEIQTTAAAGRSRRTTVLPAVPDTPAPTKAKSKGTDDDDDDKDHEESVEPLKKRGRPAKAKAAEPQQVTSTPKRGPGRPKRAPDAPAVPEEEDGPPFTRHKPPFGGETTVVHKDEEAAADQLEEEMLETAPESAEETNRKRKAPVAAKREATSGGAKKVVANDSNAVDAASATPLDKSYWLMKAEQEDRFETTKGGEVINTRFTIADLEAKTAPEPWDGVRNAVAARNMRAMRSGDLAFFYASGGKSGRKPGITGIMEIVAEATRDMTVDDPNAYGYVDNVSAREKWVIVHVEHRKTLSKPVHLSELQKYKDGVLEHMELLHQSRLSVTGVREEEWNFIVNNLIAGYAHDGAFGLKGSAVVDDGRHANSVPQSKNDGPSITDDTTVTSERKRIDTGLSDVIPGPSDEIPGPQIVLPSVESGPLDKVTEGKGASAAAKPSRQASREASRPASRAVSVRSVQQPDVENIPTRRSSRAASVASQGVENEQVTKAANRGPSRTSARQASRAPSAGPPAVVMAEPSSTHTTRAGSRGRSRTPRVNGGNAKGTMHEGGNLASVMEE